ncbi:MAG TPA: DUF3426 domain-containing protein [Geobacteraceae bacterium]|nr:DUF3426 domain-containing protein [Geobacteraceae bacterium]
MIIQCDQCDTKFKLDDARVPEKGIKVRCARCKQVFMVRKESTPEEPDLDSLLSGLESPAPGAGQGVKEATATLAPVAVGNELRIDALPPVTPEETPKKTSTGGVFERAPGDEFGEEFFATQAEPAAPEDKGFGVGEFSFEEDDAKTASTETTLPESAAGNTGEFDAADFSFADEEGATSATAVSAAEPSITDAEGFEFGARELAPDDSAETVSGAELEGPAADKSVADEFSFGEFTFGAEEEKGPEDKTPITATEEKKEEAVVPEFAAVEFSGETVAGTAASKKAESEEEFLFTPEPSAETAPAAILAAPPVEEEPAAKSSFAAQMPYAEEELPPLAISTRKKGRSIFSIAVTVVIVLIVLAVAGIGVYVLKEGPVAFDRLGLSFLAKWAGVEVPSEGGIAIKNPQGAFMVNKEAGEIFVVTGEAVNNFKKPRASIQVKGSVLGAKGEILAQKTAYCGNVLSKEQLATMPVAKIEESMGSPFGDSLINLGVQPGKSIPFVIVFTNVPKTSAEFSVEVVGSTVAD